MTLGKEQYLRLPDATIDHRELLSRSYPTELLGRYTPECINRRADYDQFYRELFLEERKQIPDLDTEIGATLLSQNLLLPRNPTKFSHVFDMVGSVISVGSYGNKTAVALVENPSFGRFDGSIAPRDTGVGKTALAMELLGVPNFLDRLPPFNPDGPTPEFSKISLAAGNQGKEIQLIAPDLSFLGLINDTLVAAPIAGVRPDARWDIARRNTRVMAFRAIHTYDRYHPYVRSYQIALAKNIFMDPALFVKPDGCIPLKHLVAINLVSRDPTGTHKEALKNRARLTEIDQTHWVALEEIPPEKGKAFAKDMLSKNPLYHTMPFWRIDPIHHRSTLEAVEEYLPRHNANLYVYAGETGYTANNAQPIFQMGASLIKTWAHL